MNIEANFKKTDPKKKEIILDEVQSVFEDALEELIAKLDKYEISYSLDAGTLLGYYRDGKPLRGDSDHDITVKIEEFYKEGGKAFIRDNFINLSSAGCLKMKDKKLVEHKLFYSGEEFLYYIEKGCPFLPKNLGYEYLPGGDTYKFKSGYRRRQALKLDIFVTYPWQSLDRSELFPEYNDSRVYTMLCGSVQYARMNSKFFDNDLLPIDLQIKDKTIQSWRYADTEDYLVSMYGESWQTPDPNYKWFNKKDYLDSKIFRSDLLRGHTMKESYDMFVFQPDRLHELTKNS